MQISEPPHRIPGNEPDDSATSISILVVLCTPQSKHSVFGNFCSERHRDSSGLGSCHCVAQLQRHCWQCVQFTTWMAPHEAVGWAFLQHYFDWSIYNNMNKYLTMGNSSWKSKSLGCISISPSTSRHSGLELRSGSTLQMGCGLLSSTHSLPLPMSLTL